MSSPAGAYVRALVHRRAPPRHVCRAGSECCPSRSSGNKPWVDLERSRHQHFGFCQVRGYGIFRVEGAIGQTESSRSRKRVRAVKDHQITESLNRFGGEQRGVVEHVIGLRMRRKHGRSDHDGAADHVRRYRSRDAPSTELAWKGFRGGRPRHRIPNIRRTGFLLWVRDIDGSRRQVLWFFVPTPCFHR